MKQQINFLKSLPQTPLQLPAKWITLATIATLVLLTWISFNMALNTVDNYLFVKQIHEENIQVTATFQQAAKAYPLLAGDMPLVDKVGALEKELQTKKNQYDTLSHTALRHGFSSYLQTLAKIVPQGLWLSDIIVNQETKTASMKGYMINPVAVSQLLQALQHSPSFAGITFHLFYVKQIPEKSYSEFELANVTLNGGPSK